MADDKPIGSDDLLAQAMRRVYREQVEGREEATEKEAAASAEGVDQPSEDN